MEWRSWQEKSPRLLAHDLQVPPCAARAGVMLPQDVVFGGWRKSLKWSGLSLKLRSIAGGVLVSGYNRNTRELHTGEDGKELQGRRTVMFPGWSCGSLRWAWDPRGFGVVRRNVTLVKVMSWSPGRGCGRTDQQWWRVWSQHWGDSRDLSTERSWRWHLVSGSVEVVGLDWGNTGCVIPSSLIEDENTGKSLGGPRGARSTRLMASMKKWLEQLWSLLWDSRDKLPLLKTHKPGGSHVPRQFLLLEHTKLREKCLWTVVWDSLSSVQLQ